MPIPPYVPITGPLGVDPLETHPTHLSKLGSGGYMTVIDIAERDAIPADRREAYMRVITSDTGNEYILDVNLTTWSPGIDTSQFMSKTDYDADNNGKVDLADLAEDSNLLGGSALATVLDRSNHTGTQAQGTVTDLINDLSKKIDLTEKGVANGVVPLDGSTKIDNA